MRFNLLNRKIHAWGSLIASLPVIVILVTGLMLQLKKEWDFVQPPEQRGTGQAPQISFEQILAACQAIPDLGIASWDDVHRIDLRPSRGLIKVTTLDDWEIQIDAGTGEVLQVAIRRSDWIESLHDGSWFHPLAKHWLFLPAGIILLVLWLTGLYLFFQPYYTRWRRRQRRETSPS